MAWNGNIEDSGDPLKSSEPNHLEMGLQLPSPTSEEDSLGFREGITLSFKPSKLPKFTDSLYLI
jgi:hypothetical protein